MLKACTARKIDSLENLTKVWKTDKNCEYSALGEKQVRIVSNKCCCSNLSINHPNLF